MCDPVYLEEIRMPGKGRISDGLRERPWYVPKLRILRKIRTPTLNEKIYQPGRLIKEPL
jgi:hypothetical protein